MTALKSKGLGASSHAVDGANHATIAVWGSAGSGKTLLAINLSFEIARLGKRVLLIDADLRRPSVASWLGLVNAGPGLTAAVRLAKLDRLDIDELVRLSAELKFENCKLDVLTGLPHPKRWSEATPASATRVLGVAAEHYEFVVLDVSSDLESDLDLNSSGISRESLTSTIVSRANLVLATFTADPIGVNRLLFDLQNLHRDYWLIANRTGSRHLGKPALRELHETLAQFTASPLRASLPTDFASCDSSIANARPLLLEYPNAKLTLAVRELAMQIVDECSAGIDSEGGQTGL